MITPQTIANITALCRQLKDCEKWVDEVSEDFANEQALSNITNAQRLIRDAVMLMRQAPTVEDHAAVMRFSLHVVTGKKQCEEVSNGK